MARAISVFIMELYSCWLNCPARQAVRARRIAGVWGKEPMVVVGKTGSPILRACFARLFPTVLCRRSMVWLIRLARERADQRQTRVDARRSLRILRFVARKSSIAEERSATARARKLTSSSFCWANADR